MGNHVQNQNSEWMPSLAARQSHREWIAGRALTLLSHYWRPDDPVELSAAMGRDWADVLEGLPQEYIQRAAIRFQQQFENKKPTPAAIYALTRELMPAPAVVPRQPQSSPSDPDRKRVTKDEAAEIMKAAGFRPKTFNAGFDDAE